MKILTVHNFHVSGSASGDDLVFRNEAGLLEHHGHEVTRYSVSNDEFYGAGPLKKLMLSAGMIWSQKNYRAISSLIESHNPDIVHVHTFFPLLSPSVLYAAKHSGKKTVVTIHDMRLVCPCASSLRNSELCSLCRDGFYLRMVWHRCFRCSAFKSVVAALIFSFHRMIRSFYNQIDRYICLNDSQIELLESAGFNPAKITKKYNFIQDTKAASKTITGLPERYAVFCGRIGEEKGIRIIMKVWDELEVNDDIPLVVMGSGPLQSEFAEWASGKRHVYFLSYTPRDQCLSVASESEFVIFPSIWYEGCSMTLIEALSLGKPVIAFDVGFQSEAISDGYNGLKVTLGDACEFAKGVRTLWGSPELCRYMGQNARTDYEAKYTPEKNYKQLMKIYNSVLEEREI